VKNNPIPGDQVRWARSFSLLAERNRYLLWQELDAAANNPTSPLETQYGNYFAACMNTGLIETKGLKPLEPAFKRIDALKNTHRLGTLMGELEAEGSAAPLFNFGVSRTIRTLEADCCHWSERPLAAGPRLLHCGQRAFQGDSPAVCRACDQDVHAGRRRA